MPQLGLLLAWASRCCVKPLPWGSNCRVRAIRPVLGLPADAYNPTLVFSLTEMTAPESNSPCASPDVPASYEEALGELERLVGAMESGQMPLDRLLESYQRGAELLSFCRARLQAVEEQVKVLEDGQLKPWMPNA